ncbi:MAG: hypothetical protein V1728_03170 [Candidatus Micrarchaeota archaeon]
MATKKQGMARARNTKAKPARGPKAAMKHRPAKAAAARPRPAGPKKSAAHKEAMNKVWCAQLMGDAKVRHWLIRNVGEHAIHVLQEFTAEMSDEEIARKADVRSSDVRVVLNKLHSFGLASYYRSRDKNSGWYSYVWRLNNERALDLMKPVENESTTMAAAPAPARDGVTGMEAYCCAQCGPDRPIPFDEASAQMFRCAQCGSSLTFVEKR